METDKRIAHYQRQALKHSHSVLWVRRRAEVSDSTYDKHVRDSETVRLLDAQFEHKRRVRKVEMIDQLTGEKFIFPNMVECSKAIDIPVATVRNHIISGSWLKQRYLLRKLI